MIIVNIDYIPGVDIVEQCGLVVGSSVRAKNFFSDIGASIKNIVGGELGAYTELLNESRKDAIDRMIKEATTLGANAIINVRFSTSAIAAGAAEIYVYGTAVKIKGM